MFFKKRRVNENLYEILQCSHQFYRIITNIFHVHLITLYIYIIYILYIYILYIYIYETNE